MSTQISVVALCFAAYTWWRSPSEQPPTVIEVPVPVQETPAEFSCSARCPAPVHQIVPSVVEPASSTSALFWIFFGAALTALLFLWRPPRRAKPSPTASAVYLPALTAGEVEEVEPVVTKGVTPQRLRLRRLRGLQDAA